MNPTLYAEQLRHVSPWLYKASAQLWIDRQFPRHLFIETTAACNLVCTFCPRERRGNHMEFKLFQQIVDEASHYGARSFSLHLFGEPLLYPHLLESIGYIKSKNRRHCVLLTTNGTRLSYYLRDLIRLHVDKIIWSWRPEVHFTPETIQELRRWGRFQVRLLKEVTPQEEFDRWKTWRPVEIKNLHNYGGNIALSSWNVKPTATKRWPCYHLFLAPAVAWNGAILLCCADPHQQETLGQFPNMSVHQAWTSPQLKGIRQSHLKGQYKGLCENCNVWKTYPDIFFPWQRTLGSFVST